MKKNTRPRSKKLNKPIKDKIKEGKTDKVSDGTLQIILAKLGKSRNELNELQELLYHIQLVLILKIHLLLFVF